MIRIAEFNPSAGTPATCGSDPNERCGNGLEKIYPSTVVRYGYMKMLGEFAYKAGMKFTCGGRVVIQTDRGIELGEQVSLTCTGCSKSISRDAMKAYARNSGEKYLDGKRGRILREATASDLQEQRHLDEQTADKLIRCRELVREFDLQMKLVECEHLLGGERIIFYFMADGRVDFRQLVKALAKEMHTRIEMRQIGARDEARLVADYETCGRECCCKAFLKTLKPISMRMAKLQKATLDPSKVSGRCGRLKCCLRYEHETYEQLDRKLPKIGKRVYTAHGDGVVVGRQVLTQLIQIEREDRQRITVVVEDILPPEARPPERPPSERQPSARGARGRAPRSAEPAPASAPAAEDGKKRRRRRRRSRRGRRDGQPDGARPESNAADGGAPPPEAGPQ